MKVNYIKTMDFTFEDVEILKIRNGTEIEYINPDYIMYFKLEDK